MDISQITAFLSLLVSLAAMMYARHQARSSAQSVTFANRQATAAEVEAKYPSLVDLLREYRCKEFTATRHYIVIHLASIHPPNGTGFRAISDQKILLEILALVHFLDNLGLFIRAKYVDHKYVSMFVGRSIETTYDALTPYITEEKLRSPDYGENLAYLVKLCNAKTQASVRKAL